MLKRDELPDDAMELAKCNIDLPYASDNSEESCDLSINHIMWHIKCEAIDYEYIKKNKPDFIRTAILNNTQYWIWRVRESTGIQYYYTVTEDEYGRQTIRYCENYGNWTPEQYMIGDYYKML